MAKFVVGITGGIGSGKTTVAKLFETLGASLIDTDEIAHELTQPGAPAVDRIRALFGEQYVDAEGALHRSEMRALVFQDPEAKRKLEAILHPLVRSEVAARIDSARGPYVLLVIPLLVETGGYPELIKRVLVVDCDEHLQVARTVQRSALPQQQVEAIMATQASREERLRAADDVIVNNAGLSELAEQVKRLHAHYLQLAAA